MAPPQATLRLERPQGGDAAPVLDNGAELIFQTEPEGDAEKLCCRFTVNNTSDDAIAYQIMATNVPAYNVRGRMDTVPKGGSRLVEIVANDSSVALNPDGRDRFRVLVVWLEQSASAQERWQQLESMDKSALAAIQQTTKLSVGQDTRGLADDIDPVPEEDPPEEAGGAAAASATAEGSDEKAAWIFAHSKGFHVDTTHDGDGCTFPTQGDRVLVHYKGTLRDGGAEFDSSWKRGTPFELVIGEGKVIKGWDEGLCTMAEGERAMLRVSAKYAYGESGCVQKVPPNADLAFDIELLCVSKPPTTSQLKAMDGAERERMITEFYAKHEPSKTSKQIKDILAKPQYVSDFPKLIKGLAKKYKESPATAWWRAQKLVPKARKEPNKQAQEKKETV